MNKRIIHTVFEQQAQLAPQQTAITEPGRSITYRELNHCANRLAHLLRALGIGRDNVVSVLMPPCINLSVALLGVFKSGGVYLPMDKAFPRRKLEQMFRQTGATVLVTTPELKALAEALVQELESEVQYLVVLDNASACTLYVMNYDLVFYPNPLPAAAHATENPALLNEPGDSNYIFYTSGSTGEAKAFLGCHDSLSHFIHWELKEFSVDASFRVSQLSQVTFDASLRDVLLPLCAGATLCIPDIAVKSNPALLIDWLEQSGVTLVHCVPSLFRLMTKELLAGGAARRCPQLRHILMAGEPLYGKDVQQWRQTGAAHAELVNLYGTSETTLAKTFHRIHETPAEASQLLHVGKPISNTVVLIMNQGMLCEPGKIGEVYIRTPFMTKGYYKNEALTRQVFVQNPHVKDRVELMHRTGDMGKYLPDGNIEILGRLDNQVKVNGIRVELNEIEQAVLRMKGVSETVIVAHKNNEQQQELICYYIGQVTTDELHAHLRQELSESIIPSYFVQMPEFPLTINGKVDKRALPRPEALVLDASEYEPVASETEQALENIWKEVLSLHRIGRKAAFFKIGGTSLKAMQVISRIYRQFEVSVKLSEMFARPTIAAMADFIAGAAGTQYAAIPALPDQPYYAATHAQQRLWIQDQVEAEQTVYNMPAAFMLEGALDIPAFRQAFAALVARHESLRTSFAYIDGSVQQQVHMPEDTPFEMAFINLTAAANPVAKAREIAMEELRRPFDLKQAPLLRACLLQLEPQKFVLLFNAHHIISDAWSEKVMLEEVLALYDAFRTGAANPLPPLRIQYRDYAAWLNEQLNGASLQRLEQYWKHQFSGEIPVLQLPTDHPRPAVKTTNGEVHYCQISPDIKQRLTALSQQEDASLYMTLLAAVNALLHRLTGQEDIVIGAPVAGRLHRDLESLVGLFVNMLALRTQFSAQDSFRQLLGKVKQTLLDAYEHQQYPFDQLVRSLDVEYDRKRSPLADVWVQLADQDFLEARELAGLRVSLFPAGYLTSKVDLTFKFSTEGEGIHVLIEYNTDLFKPGTVEHMAQQFIHLLNTIVTDHEIPLTDIALLASREETAEMEDFLKGMYSL